MSNGFQKTLNHIRSIASSETEKGRLFERLMKAYFTKDPLYKKRFSNVWLWSEWAALKPEFDGTDTGVDLVAEESEGGYCAIQCKCYAPGTQISKPHLDSFIAASARDPFTARIVVDTGDGWGPNAIKTITSLKPACNVLRFGDLASRPFDWPDLIRGKPEDLSFQHVPISLFPHQKTAIDKVIKGFSKVDRGKLIMACGTGKTFTALRIAEAIAGTGGRVLYLIPSISLFQQSMREWATQQEVPHHYIGVCSDTRAGRNDEDASLQELEIPVTTDPQKITQALQKARADVMTVVFCTYHSLEIVAKAQNDGALEFDLVLCDEAHRTTGIDRPNETKTSPFVLVHDAQKIRSAKRLYMTATPRIYTEGAKTKAADHAIDVFSMDDPDTYGPEFYRLPFSRAVDQNLLSDYKVIVLTMSEQHVDAMLQTHLASADSEINITDAAKIIGCWRALQNPENKRPEDGPVSPLTRVIAFTNTIISSKRIEKYWDDVVRSTIEQLPETERLDAFRCDVRHVDGQLHALDRKIQIEWLKDGSTSACRILSNARCLSEGIDVPALDGVLFMNPRNSQVDIVQAVGRVMRKSKGKEYGYIVLPVAVPAGIDPAEALDDNDRFAVVWSVLRALRSHDDRLDAEINKIDLNKAPTNRIIFSDGGIFGEEDQEMPEFAFPPLNLPPDAIFAKIVEKCGDRKYWDTWAKDVADIFSRLVGRIKGLLENTANESLCEWFDSFHEELRVSINESINRDSAIDMMAQHILTRPVFEALFEHYDFSAKNPVAKALDALQKDFGEFGLENEIRDMELFYESVRMRARGLDNSEARQRVLMELYEKFFSTALKKDANRLGIVYTPVEIVDFIINSTGHVLRQEFGRCLSDENVNILDPFTGTGIFLVRLLQSKLIKDSDLERKYRKELHANEIVLLAYYIAAIHIEEAFHGRRGPESVYEPFSGIVLTDTFNLHTDRTGFPRVWLPDNSERVERQQKLPIQVIVGNPPWSAGQRSSADNNPNVDYPEIEKRVSETYAAHSKATLKSSLYDTYKMAIRWASDRIGEQGVAALVTNGSWVDGNVDSGVRACLAKEFSSIYVLNLRGNARTSGELRRSEGDNVFGQGSRAPVAITILVRNPDAEHDGCRILYHDIGNYLNRKEKLTILREAESIASIKDWQTITPDSHYDWIAQRSEAFQLLYPIGSKAAKAGLTEDAIFKLFSSGYKTSRDAYIYNYSREGCAENARKMVNEYLAALREWAETQNQSTGVDSIANRHSTNVRWDRELKNNLKRNKEICYRPNNIAAVQYRPFVKQHCYVEYVLVNNKYQMNRIFPDSSVKNHVICVSGAGSKKPFSALMVDTMPDLGLMSASQCFPRYRYLQTIGTQKEIPGVESDMQPVDNISDTALNAFRVYYGDNTISKDEIFHYVYGILHAPEYRKRFANDLDKELPRVPFAEDFRAFANAGHKLVELHLGYETCDEYPLNIEFTQSKKPQPEHFLIGVRAMRFTDSEKVTLIVNEHIRLTNIPTKAHQYQVNGRTPLEWLIDRYKITQDKESGIINDPNAWFDDPRDLITTIRRIVHASVETVHVIKNLPEPFVMESDAG